MRLRPGRASKAALLFVFFYTSAIPLGGQGVVQPLITQPVDDTKLMVLHGNTHPLARAEFDRGALATNLQLNHMQLILKRSPEQEAALEKLMSEQLDRSSPNYHKWVTPEQFGEQFGPSDQDILTITAWLQSHGFTIANSAKGKMTIDFSGTVGQVQQAFHTAIHKYVIDGEEHWANAKDPAIPIALARTVVGVASFHNFLPRPQSTVRPARQNSRPLYTFPAGCSESTSSSNNNPCSYGLGPADFEKIYNVPSSLTGTGETIAIVSDSDIDPTDVDQFRQIFGLPPKNFQQIETDPANDPGISGPNGNEVEAVLDVEWAGAIAPAAKIDLVVSPDTATTSGIDTSAQYIVDNQLAPIMSVSYGLCELDLGTAGNQFHNSLWQQAAAEGITVLVSTGDNGSAGCDIVEVNGPPTQPAMQGLEVNGLASTAYNVAVGGTDFNDPTPSTYWSTTNNGTTQASALSYIPEMTWNDTCTSSIVIQFFNDGNAATACNDPAVQQFDNSGGVFLVGPTGGSGGMSNCTTNSTTSTTTGPPSSCSGGYQKPTWQTGPGVPNDGKRDLPDLSMFAGDGLISGSFYIICEADLNSTTSNNAPCNLASEDFVAVGGTSVSAQAMAGITALIDQKEGSAQGNINPTLYALASQQAPSSCNSSSPLGSCVFNNVTMGTIEMPCAKGSPNCTVTGNNPVGVLTGYNAGTGYNLATGLGSINVANLTNSWGPTFYLSSTNPAVTVTNPGGAGNLAVTVNAVNGFTGNIMLACSGLPSGDTCSFSPSASVSLSSTNTSTPVMVTIQTANAELIPEQHPWGQGPALLAVGSVSAALFASLGLAIMFLPSCNKRTKIWFATVAFLAAIAVGGCAGNSGGGGGGGGGGGMGTTNATLTGTSGSVASSMAFTLTVQ